MGAEHRWKGPATYGTGRAHKRMRRSRMPWPPGAGTFRPKSIQRPVGAGITVEGWG